MNFGARAAPLTIASSLPIPRIVASPSTTKNLLTKMEYRKLGNTGLDVSVLSFGSWVSFDYQLGVPQAKEIMHACYESGVNFVS